MATIEQLIQGQDGAISFGDYTLEEKAKVDNYEYGGDIYKVKTHKVMTKLEKNGMFAYESVPGTSVVNFLEDGDGVSFKVQGTDDAQITVGLEDETLYSVGINGEIVGDMRTNVGGKLSLSVELAGVEEVDIRVLRA